MTKYFDSETHKEEWKEIFKGKSPLRFPKVNDQDPS
jgi:hypothetical protein